MKTTNNRTTNYQVNDMFLNRYSPRALSGEKITKEELMTLFDAARWAPSAYNSQPWKFIYAERDTPHFEKLFSFLADGNKVWCKNAAALVVTISSKNFDNGKPSITHSFDTGAAWENLTLQANTMNLVAHGISGFDFELAKKELGVPEDYNVEMMIAIGKHGKIEDLPKNLREIEKPNDRKPLEGIISEGKF